MNLTPESLALLMGGANMMAASRGGNTDLTKGGLGYALQQGMTGALQGAQIGQGFEDARLKREAIKNLPGTLPENVQERARALLASGANPMDVMKALGMGASGGIGQYNPRDYTVGSFAEFVKTRDPSVLVRHTEKTVNVGGVPHYLTPNGYVPIKSASDVASNQATIEDATIRAREQAKNEATKDITKETQGHKLTDAMEVYNYFKDKDLDKIYGMGETVYPDLLRSEEGHTMIAKRDQLIAMLQLAGRGELKGQGTITDTEQKTVADAATILGNQSIDPKEARKALDDAMRILFRNAGKDFNQDVPKVRKYNPATGKIE